MNHLKKKGYELGITPDAVDRAVRWTRVIKTKRGGASHGGAYGMRFNLNYWQIDSRWWGEYASFDKCPVIGGRKVRSAEESYWLMVAHEVSHHVQYSRGPLVSWLKGNYRKPHGQGFRTIYAMLRSGLINPMLTRSIDEI